MSNKQKASPSKIAGETVHSVPQIEKVINELGEQGWELTTTWEYAVSGKGGPTLFFKRPKIIARVMVHQKQTKSAPPPAFLPIAQLTWLYKGEYAQQRKLPIYQGGDTASV